MSGIQVGTCLAALLRVPVSGSVVPSLIESRRLRGGGRAFAVWNDITEESYTRLSTDLLIGLDARRLKIYQVKQF